MLRKFNYSLLEISQTHFLGHVPSYFLVPEKITFRYLKFEISGNECKENRNVSVHYCPPTLVEGDYSNGFVRPFFRQSVRRHNLVSASPPTVFKGC